MRLFLASQDFGEHGDRLSRMTGDNRRALVVSNARDYTEDKGLDRQWQLFANHNLEFQELDLREYFGKSGELREFIDGYNPGLIVLLGGNTFLLRRALAQSGLDEIIKSDVAVDKYVIAGHSAGSIVAGPSLHGFELMDKETLVLPGYQSEVVWSGLGLTDMRVIPHVGSEKYTQAIIDVREKFDSSGLKHVALHDTAVFVVDGNIEEVI